jgi:hypothetical protein
MTRFTGNGENCQVEHEYKTITKCFQRRHFWQSSRKSVGTRLDHEHLDDTILFRKFHDYILLSSGYVCHIRYIIVVPHMTPAPLEVSSHLQVGNIAITSPHTSSMCQMSNCRNCDVFLIN